MSPGAARGRARRQGSQCLTHILFPSERSVRGSVLQVLARKHGTSHNFRTTLLTGNEHCPHSGTEVGNAFGFVWSMASLHFDFTLSHSTKGHRKQVHLTFCIRYSLSAKGMNFLHSNQAYKSVRGYCSSRSYPFKERADTGDNWWGLASCCCGRSCEAGGHGQAWGGGRFCSYLFPARSYGKEKAEPERGLEYEVSFPLHVSPRVNGFLLVPPLLSTSLRAP